MRRKLRLQRVEEEVRRRVVLGFFDMLYYSRQFKRHMESKKAGRMTAIPQLDVPEILVDNEEQRADRQAGKTYDTEPLGGGGGSGTLTTPEAVSLLSAAAADISGRHRHWSDGGGLGADLSSYDTSYGHPLAGPRTSKPASPRQRNATSAFSFELAEPAEDGNEDDTTSPIGRRGSSVSPAAVRDVLDDSVWVESIRRSTTMRKSGWGPSGTF